jgi:hypothetical protein
MLQRYERSKHRISKELRDKPQVVGYLKTRV